MISLKLERTEQFHPQQIIISKLRFVKLNSFHWNFDPVAFENSFMVEFFFVHLRVFNWNNTGKSFFFHKSEDKFRFASQKINWTRILISCISRTFKMTNKLNVLKYNEFILSRFGMYRDHLRNSINDFNAFALNFYILFVSVAFMISSTIFAHQNLAQFDIALRTSIFVLGTAQSLGMFISFGLNKVKVQAVHVKLQELIDKSTAGMSYWWIYLFWWILLLNRGLFSLFGS